MERASLWSYHIQTSYRKLGNFHVSKFHVVIFRVKIFLYASRPYETMKVFTNDNLEYSVAYAYVHGSMKETLKVFDVKR